MLSLSKHVKKGGARRERLVASGGCGLGLVLVMLLACRSLSEGFACRSLSVGRSLVYPEGSKGSMLRKEMKD